MTLYEKIGNQIREGRIKANMTQEDLADRLFMAEKSTISAWENGRKAPNIDRLEAICKLLDIKITIGE